MNCAFVHKQKPSASAGGFLLLSHLRAGPHRTLQLRRVTIRAASTRLTYDAIAVTFDGKLLWLFGTACGRSGRSHPAASQAWGIENSDQPQSRQTRISGEGVMGGWLRVLGTLRKSLTSAGITDRAPDSHFGHTIKHLNKYVQLWGRSNSNSKLVRAQRELCRFFLPSLESNSILTKRPTESDRLSREIERQESFEAPVSELVINSAAGEVAGRGPVGCTADRVSNWTNVPGSPRHPPPEKKQVGHGPSKRHESPCTHLRNYSMSRPRPARY